MESRLESLGGDPEERQEKEWRLSLGECELLQSSGPTSGSCAPLAGGRTTGIDRRAVGSLDFTCEEERTGWALRRVERGSSCMGFPARTTSLCTLVQVKKMLWLCLFHIAP